MSTKGALMAPCWMWLRLKCPTMCTSVPLATSALASRGQRIHNKMFVKPGPVQAVCQLGGPAGLLRDVGGLLGRLGEGEGDVAVGEGVLAAAARRPEVVRQLGAG